MTLGWKTAKLGEVCRIAMGGTPPRNNARYFDRAGKSGHVWLSIADLPLGIKATVTDSKERLSDEGAARVRVVPAGTLLVSFKLTLGRLAFAGCDLRTNEAIAALCDLSERIVSRDYLYWFLTFFDWQKAAEGEDKVKGKTLNKAKLEQLEIALPPVAEQQRIVACLEEAFGGINTAADLAQANLSRARIFLNETIRYALEQAGPSWQETTIGAQVTLQRGVDITKAAQRPGNVPVVSSGGIRSYHSEALVKAPGVVMGRKGTLGKVFYLEQDFWPHDTSLYVRDFKGNDPRFVYYFFRVLDVSRLDSGAANPALNRNIVHALPVRWPPIETQKAIASKLDGLSNHGDALIGLYERKLAALAELKQSILARAFSGELTREPVAA